MLPYAGIETSGLLTQAMKVAQENHRVIASNIANADTPHYNSMELDFQKTLQSYLGGTGSVALRTTRPAHLEGSMQSVDTQRLAFLSKNDYNKVDLDDQMAKLSENTGKYTTYGSLLVKHFDEVKTIITSLR